MPTILSLLSCESSCSETEASVPSGFSSSSPNSVASNDVESSHRFDEISLIGEEEQTSVNQADSHTETSCSTVSVVVHEMLQVFRHGREAVKDDEPGRKQRADETSDLDRTDQNASYEYITHESQTGTRIDNFRKARLLRSTKYTGSRAMGILGLYIFMEEMRLDLEWSEDAVYRQNHDLPYLSWIDFENLHRSKSKLVKQKFCWFTLSVFLISTGTLLYSVARNEWSFAPVRENPMLGPTGQVLLDIGALDANKIVYDREWWRLITAVFLHAGIIHYIINMFALNVIGRHVEHVHGSVTTAIVFLLASFGGNLASATFSPRTISVGTSGGIFSLIGVCLADVSSNWNMFRLDSKFPHMGCLLLISFELVLNLSIGLMPYIDNFCHLGGLVYGISFGVPLIRRISHAKYFGQTSSSRRVVTLCSKGVVFFIGFVLFLMTFWILYTSDPDSGPPNVCPQCRFISCVPFPFGTEDKWWYCDGCETISGTVVKKASGDMIFELNCPGGDMPLLNFTVGTKHEAIRKGLTKFCRKYCKL